MHALPPEPGPHNLKDYAAVRKTFSWDQAAADWPWAGQVKINLAYEACDRHVEGGYGAKTALRYLDGERDLSWTFGDLKRRSDQYAVLLKRHGLQTGDRVFIFLPKIPELYAALLGTIKAGAVAGPLFEAFYQDALRDRMGDCGARFLITDSALLPRVPQGDLPALEKIFVLTEAFPPLDLGSARWTPHKPVLTWDRPAPEKPELDLLTELAAAGAALDPAAAGAALGGGGLGPSAPGDGTLSGSGPSPAAALGTPAAALGTPPAALGTPEPTTFVDPEAGLIIHYTSGSTGKPKGILHAHRALLHHALTGRWVLDLRDDDVYWCTAHPGWVTGSSYGVFAPWLNRATLVVNGGRFDADAWYGLIAQTGVTVWYSAPTAFRMLLAAPEKARLRYDLTSLRHILSVGEPLNPELVHWGRQTFGVRIHDTWWMTETGGQLIVNLPGEPVRPGSMGRPFPGIEAAILDDQGQPVPDGVTGHLAVKTPWPGLMKSVWNNPAKYAEYFRFAGWYLSGDSAYKDPDGYIWFQGRGDDLITASGEKVSPFEVESTLIEHPAVAEAGVIGKPDPVRGAVVKAFIVLRDAVRPEPALLGEIKQFVKTRLSAHAYPKEIEVLEALPKTRVSGKIMRRVLKAWETGADVGDTTTLEGRERRTLLKETP